MKHLGLRFSLGTLFLLVTIVVLAVSHSITSRRLSKARTELQNYRYQYGHLVVDDPTRPHVLGYANLENPWKWHVNFPEGKNYKIRCGVGDIPTSGIPNAADLQHVQETWVTGTGEDATMFVSLVEVDSERFRFSIGCDESQTVHQIIPKTDAFTKIGVFNQFKVGHGEPFTANPDEPFVVFFQTERTTNSTGNVENGVVVWVEPVG